VKQPSGQAESIVFFFWADFYNRFYNEIKQQVLKDLDYANKVTGCEVPEVGIYGSNTKDLLVGVFALDKVYVQEFKAAMLHE